MLEAYLDESGIHDGAEICMIAGYFGRQNHWGRFERDWKGVLAKFGFALKDFHAKNLINSRRQQPMLQELGDAIARHKIYPLSAGVIVPDFNSLTLPQRKFCTGATLRNGKLVGTGSPTKPYFLPFQLCLMKVTDDTPPGGKAHCFFGLDRPFAEYARIMFAKIKNAPYTSMWKTKNRLGDPSFPQAKETPELQAADLLVHLSYKRALECHETNNWRLPVRGVLASCLRNTKNMREYHVMQNKACLLQTFKNSVTLIGTKAAAPILHNGV
jgi:hypothetical protein